MHAYTRTYMHTHAQIHTHAYVSTHAHDTFIITCMHTYGCTHLRAHMQTQIHIYYSNTYMHTRTHRKSRLQKVPTIQKLTHSQGPFELGHRKLCRRICDRPVKMKLLLIHPHLFFGYKKNPSVPEHTHRRRDICWHMHPCIDTCVHQHISTHLLSYTHTHSHTH